MIGPRGPRASDHPAASGRRLQLLVLHYTGTSWDGPVRRGIGAPRGELSPAGLPGSSLSAPRERAGGLAPNVVSACYACGRAPTWRTALRSHPAIPPRSRAARKSRTPGEIPAFTPESPRGPRRLEDSGPARAVAPPHRPDPPGAGSSLGTIFRQTTAPKARGPAIAVARFWTPSSELRAQSRESLALTAAAGSSDVDSPAATTSSRQHARSARERNIGSQSPCAAAFRSPPLPCDRVPPCS